MWRPKRLVRGLRESAPPSGGILTSGRHRGLHGRLVERLGRRGGEAAYAFFASGLAVAGCAFLAWVFKQPLLFPSLGPTAYLFFESPMGRASSPRNTLISHLVAVIAGGVSLTVFGLFGGASILAAGPTAAHVASGVLSVALTGGAVLLLRASHPPAGATTLIVSLGLLNTAPEMLTLLAGVAILTAAGLAINRACGIPAPLWSAKE